MADTRSASGSADRTQPADEPAPSATRSRELPAALKSAGERSAAAPQPPLAPDIAPANAATAPAPAAAPTRLYALLAAHPGLAFALLGASFALFGLASLNLVQMLGANFEFLARHGFDAVREGGLVQFVELVVSGYGAAVFYLLFKLCEKALVERLSSARPPTRER